MDQSSRCGTIVFVDNFRWISFDQTAASLRHLGARVVRVTNEDTRPARLVDAVIYDESHRYSGPEGLAEVLAGFDREDLLDVVTVDALVPVVARMPMERMPARVAERLRARARWVDKLETARALAAAGVAVPDTRDGATTTPEAAVADLGLPVVVKARIGAGGAGVRVATSIEQARAAAVELGTDPAGFYFERFADGPQWCYTAACSEGRVLDEAAYDPAPAQDAALGPSTSIVVRDDEGILRAGRAAVAALGADGVVGLDLVGPPEDARVIDVNYRVSNATILLRGAGCRFDRGYLAALTGDTSHRPRTGRAGTELTLFPARVHAGIQSPRGLDPRTLLRDVRPFVIWAGPRYVLAALLGIADLWAYERGIGTGSPAELLRGLGRELARRARGAGPSRVQTSAPASTTASVAR